MQRFKSSRSARVFSTPIPPAKIFSYEGASLVLLSITVQSRRARPKGPILEKEPTVSRPRTETLRHAVILGQREKLVAAEALGAEAMIAHMKGDRQTAGANTRPVCRAPRKLLGFQLEELGPKPATGWTTHGGLLCSADHLICLYRAQLKRS
jgi:hypothetical protein